MRSKLNLRAGDLRVESFETRELPGLQSVRATARNCPSCTCGGPSPPIVAEAVATCFCCA
ncbi:MAG TPA: hypothetical protein VFQ39_05605 [Longimicrobium sp.]|nr:hypothetical protein [Longimicrobium sp.]